MDLRQLPENPKSREEELALPRTLEKGFAVPLASLPLDELRQALGKLSKQEIYARTYALVLVLGVNLGVINNSSNEEGVNPLAFLIRFLEIADQNQLSKLRVELERITRALSRAVCKSNVATNRACGALLLALQSQRDWQALTSIHTDFLQVCLKGKMYSLACTFCDTVLQGERGVTLPNAQQQRNSSSSPTLSTFALDLQRFFYYAGIVYAGVERFANARDQFLQCLSLPSKTTSAVQYEAFKKYLLCGLIACDAQGHSSLLPLPAYCSPCVLKSFPPAASEEQNAYMALRSAFEKTDAGQALDQVCTDLRYASEFTKAGNAGLVDQVREAYLKMRVIKLTDTYLTLGFAELQDLLGLGKESVEPYLSRMIQRGEIKASLDQEAMAVRFLDECDLVPQQKQDAMGGDVYLLQAELERIANLAKDLRVFDTRLSTSKSYMRGTTLGRTPPNKRAAMEEEGGA